MTLIIVVCVIAYLVMGCVSEYMKGYASPDAQRRTSLRTDWTSMIIWPYSFASTVGDYGAAKRLAAPGN